MSGRDRMIGIVLGLLIGVAAVIIFVFAGGSGNIDAPSLDQPGAPESSAPAAEGPPSPRDGDAGQQP
jgi:hypothetical protein